ncbi:MAG: TRAM domain-containing protein, partial [Solirubrobacterales bacterium]
LGLVEMTRQNITDGVREILTTTCPTCDGDGVVLSAETDALDGLRKMKEFAAEESEAEAFLLRVHPKVAALLNTEDSGLAVLEEETGKRFLFEGGDALAIDNFELIETGGREEIEARALPFSPGDEVLVTIEEPHMFSKGAGVARIDSYIVSVEGAAGMVGQRKMVRIEAVDRASAEAILLGDSDGEDDGSGRDVTAVGADAGGSGG